MLDVLSQYAWNFDTVIFSNCTYYLNENLSQTQVITNNKPQEKLITSSTWNPINYYTLGPGSENPTVRNFL